MDFNELSNEARRHLINVQQPGYGVSGCSARSEASICGVNAVARAERPRVPVRKQGKAEKSLGARSPETEAAYALLKRPIGGGAAAQEPEEGAVGVRKPTASLLLIGYQNSSHVFCGGWMLRVFSVIRSASSARMRCTPTRRAQALC